MKRTLQAATASTEPPQGDGHVAHSLPHVLFIPDVCRVLGISRRTLERLRSYDVFPIPELPALDKRPRWSRIAVEQFLASRPSVHGSRRLRAVPASRKATTRTHTERVS